MGASGFRGKMMTILRQNEYIHSKFIETIYVDQNIDKTSIEGKRFISEEDYLKLEKQKNFNIAIGNFITFTPKDYCKGNAHIEDYAYIRNLGKMILPNLPTKDLRGWQ